MFVYMPIAGYTALYGFYMLNELSKVRNELTVMIQENQSRKVTTTPKKAIPTDIFQSFKEVAKNSAEMKPKQIELKPK